MASFYGLTFVQPITEPVEDDALLAGRHQTNGAALHCRAIVDVVLKNEYLQEPERDETHSIRRQNNSTTIFKLENTR